MALITCYDPEGVAHAVEAVDAREYLKSGHYTSERKEKVEVADPIDQAAEQEAERVRLAEAAAKLASEQGADTGKLTIADLRDTLTARGIAFEPAAKKADLQALLDAAQ